MYVTWRPISRTETAVTAYGAPDHNILIFRCDNSPYGSIRYDALPLETADKLRHAQDVDALDDSIAAICNSLRYGTAQTTGQDWEHTFDHRCSRCDELTTHRTLVPELALCLSCGHNRPTLRTIYCRTCGQQRQHRPEAKTHRCVVCSTANKRRPSDFTLG